MASKTRKSRRVKALRVTGPEGGFRRAGRRFGPEPTDLALTSLTEAQIAALKAEPSLMVEEVEIEPADEDAPADE